MRCSIVNLTVGSVRASPCFMEFTSMKTLPLLVALACVLALGHATRLTRPNLPSDRTSSSSWRTTRAGAIPGTTAIPSSRRRTSTPWPPTGLRLNRFYTAHFNCSPTRASIMTGRHPHRMGTFSPGSPIRAQELTVAQVLQSGRLRHRALRQVAPQRQERRQEHHHAARPRHPRHRPAVPRQAGLR